MKKLYFSLVICLLCHVAFSQSVTRLGNNYFMVAVDSRYFNYARVTHTGDQHRTMWCWAACCQMILNFHGLRVTQEQIVYRCFGTIEDAPGGEDEMFTALSGTASNIWGRYSGIGTQSVEMNYNIAAVIKNEIENNRPLAVGLSNPGQNIGHENVITGVTYTNSYDYNGNIIGFQIISVILRDPFPTSQNRIEMKWDDFYNRANSLNTVYVDYR